jgi:hypothetical protein
MDLGELFNFCFVFLAVLVFIVRASHLSGRCSTCQAGHVPSPRIWILFYLFLRVLCLNSGLHAYKALLLEPYLPSILLWLFYLLILAVVILEIGSFKLLPWAGLGPQFSQSQPPKKLG